MNKRTYTLLLLMALVMGASAADVLKVAGNSVSLSGSGSVTVSGNGISGSVTYNKDTKTLKLYNATISPTSNSERGIESSLKGLTIQVSGTNKIVINNNVDKSALRLSADATVKGSGSLTISSTGSEAILLREKAMVTIEGETSGFAVDVKGKYGVRADTKSETLTLSGHLKAIFYGSEYTVKDIETLSLRSTDYITLKGNKTNPTIYNLPWLRPNGMGLSSPANAVFDVNKKTIIVNGSTTGYKGDIVYKPFLAINEENFPDANFRSWLLSQDFGKNGYISDASLANITYINVTREGISNLKGIENFTALLTLACTNNNLTALDLKQNTSLTNLVCSSNRLTTLDLSGNTKLNTLECSNNNLTALDLSGNTALVSISCKNNSLKSLVVSKNAPLKILDCSRNQINFIEMEKLIASLPNVSNKEFIVFSHASNDRNVCSKDQVAAAKKKGWLVNCYLPELNINGAYDGDRGIEISDVNIPDANFRNFLLSQSYGADRFLSDLELGNLTALDVSGKGISSLRGIEHFIELSSLNCSQNQLTSLDLSENTELVMLTCNNNKLTSLDLYKNTKLAQVVCHLNQLSGELMDAFIRCLPSVKAGVLCVCSDDASELNDCSTLQVENAKEKGWKVICYKHADNDTAEYEGSEPGVYINATNFPDEKFRNYLMTQDYGKDNYLTRKEMSSVTKLELSNKGIGNLTGIGYFTQLNTLFCDGNQLTTLDVSQNTELNWLACYDNQINGVQMTQLVNSLPSRTDDSTPGKFYVIADNETEQNVCTTVQVEVAQQKNWTVFINSDGGMAPVEYAGSDPGIAINEDNFPDENFRSCVATKAIDQDQNGYLDETEVLAVTKLDVHGKEIKDLTGIGHFTALQELRCYGNQINGTQMDALVNSLPSVSDGQFVVAENSSSEQNLCTVLQVAVAKEKGWTVCYSNGHAYAGCDTGIVINEENFPDENFRACVSDRAIDKDGSGYLADEEIAAVTRMLVRNKSILSLTGIEYFTALTYLDCDGNQLTELDLSQNTALKTLDCLSNQLSSLNVSKNIKLENLMCNYNQLTTLDVSENEALTSLMIAHNQLTTLDLSNNKGLKELHCDWNVIRGEGMEKLVNSLPEIEGEKDGIMYVLLNGKLDKNRITQKQVKVATDKRWKVQMWDSASSSWVDYEGLPEGDVNADGVVDDKDVEAITDYIMGRLPGVDMWFYDANGDKVVNAADIVYINNLRK